MTIRKMNFSDLDQVVKLYRDANLFANLKDIKSWTLEGLEKYPDYNFVLEQKGKIIAAISAIRKNKNTVEINDITVLKDKRNRKIGTILMEYFLKNISSSTLRKIFLWVHWKNAAAIPFYYKFGFKIKKVLQTKNIIGVPNGEDTIILEKFI